jgi:hypothetical protein
LAGRCGDVKRIMIFFPDKKKTTIMKRWEKKNTQNKYYDAKKKTVRVWGRPV